MSSRRLRISGGTAAMVRSLHPDLKRKIKAALQAILTDSQAGKSLKDELEGFKSFKVGKFRVVYKRPSDEEIVEIVAIGPRKTIYEETLRLLKKQGG
jgi:mRNA interferase RelE/StbE